MRLVEWVTCENDWLACAEPEPMLGFLRAKASDRKVRLFACTCCRRIWRFLPEPSKNAVETNELFADGAKSFSEWSEVMLSSREAEDNANIAAAQFLLPHSHSAGATAVNLLFEGQDAVAVSTEAANAIALDSYPQDARNARYQERVSQCSILRDIFGNPFRPVTADSAWRTPTVVALAQAIYAERSFDRMPILADALEDAGCTNQDILSHCRSGGEHVRGCWVIDLLTGRA
jgi:hypothetical protein